MVRMSRKRKRLLSGSLLLAVGTRHLRIHGHRFARLLNRSEWENAMSRGRLGRNGALEARAQEQEPEQARAAILELARALARQAAQEDDAAEHAP
jgi:hypothetical protein